MRRQRAREGAGRLRDDIEGGGGARRRQDLADLHCPGEGQLDCQHGAESHGQLLADEPATHKEIAHRNAEQQIAHQIHGREQAPTVAIEEHEGRPESRQVPLHLRRVDPEGEREEGPVHDECDEREQKESGPSRSGNGARRLPRRTVRGHASAPGSSTSMWRGSSPSPRIRTMRASAGKSGRILSAHSMTVTPSPCIISSRPSSSTSVRASVR